MDIDLSELPDDVTALKAVVIAACAKADAVTAELANEQARRADDAALIAHMKLQIEKLKRDKYGPKSERASRLLDQMALELEELEGAATEDELAAERAAAKTTNVAPFIRNRPARKPFPDHLPRQLIMKYRFVAAMLGSLLPVGVQASPLYSLAKSIPLGGAVKWDYLHFDAASDRVFIAHGPVVSVVDAKSGTLIGALANLPGSHGIGVAPDGLIYADSAERSVVVAFDPKTLMPVAIAPVLADADGINYDPTSHTMYVSGGDGDGLTPVSTVTRQAGPKIDLGSGPEFHVADGKGSEYVDMVDTNAIARIDTATNKITATWPVAPCQHPKGLAIDDQTRRLFASCANGMAVVIDADNGKIITSVPIGKGTDAADFDPANRRFFASNGDGTLTVVKENAPNSFSILANVSTEPGARTMALNPATGDVFLVTAAVSKTVPATTPDGHPHYTYVPGSLKLLIYVPAA